MKKVSLMIYAIVFAFVFFTVSCAKDGEIGPQGPKGDTGEIGPQGEQGEQGEDGDDGVANFKNLLFEDQEWTVFSGNERLIDIPVAEIDSSIITNGVVLVYMDNNYFNISIPWTDPNNITYGYYYRVGTVRIVAYCPDGMTSDPNYNRFRIMIFGATTKSAIENKVDMANYEEVVSFFN